MRGWRRGKPLWARPESLGRRRQNWASCVYANTATTPAAMGCVSLPRIRSELDRRGDLRGPARARARPPPAVKKTACGTCGRVQRGWYDRKRRRVRDLGCGDLRIYLEVEVRRVACRRCGQVKQERLAWGDARTRAPPGSWHRPSAVAAW